MEWINAWAPVIGPAGAVVAPAPQALKNLIDDTEATDWQPAATQGADGNSAARG